MNFKTFIFGLLASFGLPWLLAIAVPFGTMRSLEPVAYDSDKDGREGFYSSGRAGQITQGSEVYGEEGCYYCHTQLIRTTDAGRDIWRADWAGLRKTDAPYDTRRATTAFDFEGENFAHVGLARIGPDLSNFGRRLEARLARDKSTLTPEEWVYLHLFNPRNMPAAGQAELIATAKVVGSLNEHSPCPAKPSLFKRKDANLFLGEALPMPIADGQIWVPTSRAKSLASYLLSLKKDTLNNPLPASLDHRVMGEELPK